ncbi:hypothetical protein BT63DRAFT_94074 [Microthyrium microscopicum]|uniref:Uncharacterized protein n=1 Tax=Microthyrium microscopicum TaxID=703497 RepID=A0A6A6TXT0_9PEZI|nr:hypothetical protein BT63DRAFT_94074 [Microthyrium microscopicum]
MEIPTGAERFTFPGPNDPNSPPSTPESASSFKAPTKTTPIKNKRRGIIGPMISPPEHIAPVSGHKFSYAPLFREISSDSDSSEQESESETEDSDSSSEADDTSDIEIEAPEAPEVPEAPSAPPRAPCSRRSSMRTDSSSNSEDSDESEDHEFILEEITIDDISYDSEAEILQPSQTEDAASDIEVIVQVAINTAFDDFFLESSSSSSESDDDYNVDNSGLADDMERLRCAARQEQKEFDEKQRQRYLRKKKRWSKGGNHKRNLAESIGSDSDNEDIMPLDDFEMLGSSARRLRRRTEGPEMRPRRSLLFEDPPKEIEELKYLNGEDDNVLDTDDELMLPPWMYPGMEVHAMVDEGDVEEPPTPRKKGGKKKKKKNRRSRRC